MAIKLQMYLTLFINQSFDRFSKTHATNDYFSRIHHIDICVRENVSKR